MPGTNHAWADFRAFLLYRRAEQPRPEAASGAERQRGEVLADVLAEWLRANAARFEPPRGRGLFGGSTAPHFLYETDAACLDTISDRALEMPEGLTLVSVDELQAWRDDHPDRMGVLYPIVSSFFTTGLPSGLYKRALARYPLRFGEEHFLHCRSVWLTPSSGHGSDDLWKGDEERMTFLKPRFSHWRT